MTDDVLDALKLIGERVDDIVNLTNENVRLRATIVRLEANYEPFVAQANALHAQLIGARLRIGALEQIIRDQLATIQAFNEENRWRDPAVESPEAYAGVLALQTDGFRIAERRDHVDESWSWGEVDGNSLNVGMFPVLGWRPLPAPPTT